MRSLSQIERAVVRCTRCPELRAYTATIAREKKRAHLECTYWGKPVPAFGSSNARIALVGLAPGAHGSNRTGRPFTGDASGDFLYPALYRAGLASQPNAVDRDDGLRLHDCFITAAVRCAPPKNKPTPQELRNCFPYLVEEFAALRCLRVVVGLGAIGFTATLRALLALGYELDPLPPLFKHGSEVVAVKGDRRIVTIASYHPSRQNTNTGKLTAAMFDAVFTRATHLIAPSRRR
jgi:uracil-DNA glycosylase family 4